MCCRFVSFFLTPLLITWYLRISTVKYVPEWMPGADFQRKARIWRVPITEMAVLPFMVVKQALVSYAVYVNQCRSRSVRAQPFS